MAYNQIPTGYSDTGPMGAWWAGQNAAAAEGQNRMQNLADMFDIQQKQEGLQHSQKMNPLLQEQQVTSNTTGGINLADLRRSQPGRTAKTASDNLFYQTLFNDPEYNTGRVAATKAADQTTARDNRIGAATEKSKTASQIANFDEIVNSQIGPQAARMASMDPSMHITYLNNLNLPIPLKDTLAIAASQGPAGLQRLADAIALNAPSHVTKMAEIKQQGQNQLDVANVTANGYVKSAERALEQAKLAAEKQETSLQVATLNGIAENIKLTQAQIDSDISKFRSEDKQSPAFKDLLDRRKELSKLLDQATKRLIKLAGGEVGAAVPPGVPVPTPTPGVQNWIMGPDGVPIPESSGGSRSVSGKLTN